ncbi:MAG TPA: M56 family metallopeptidase [Saprospiraceae bacterium]|nr:M56 family metallopeptidase [Saprospiraceae bacterium]
MITYLIQVTVCMAAFYSFYLLALRKETFFRANRFYLLISLILSLTFPLIRIYIDLNQTKSLAMVPVYVGTYMQTVEIGNNTAQKGFNFSWQEIFMMIYGVGVLLLAIRFLFSIRAIMVLKSKATLAFVENQLCAISPQVKSPFSFLNLVYLPGKHSFSQQEMEEVICHERAHVEGRHSIDVIMLEILSIFLWLNPLIYLYKKSIKEIHEFIADAAVVKKTHWTVYSEFLVQQKEQCFQGSLTSPLNHSILKKRLQMMAGVKSPATWKLIGTIPIAIFVFGLVSCQPRNEVISTPSSMDNAIVEKVDTIQLNHQLQYFMNGFEISKESLSNAIRTGANHNLQRTVILQADRHNTAGEVAAVLDVADQVDARMVLLTED